MKNFLRFLPLLLSLCISIASNAQDDDSRYMTGAVPEVNGKVVFSKEFSIPGMIKDTIYNRMKAWMNARLLANKNDSRVVYTNPEKGQIVGAAEEWIVFSSSALSLDRTIIQYQPTVVCENEQCRISISRIRYIYGQEKEKYTAEEWITDKYALNKSKTKLIKGMAKWRRKTVDFSDSFFKQASEALRTSSLEEVLAPYLAAAQEEPEHSYLFKPRKHKDKEREKEATVNPIAKPTTEVITLSEKKENVISAPSQQTATEATGTLRPIKPSDIPADAIQIGKGTLVVKIGTSSFNMTTMTANAGGSLGNIDNKAVVFCILSPEQPHELLDSAELYKVYFYPNGQTEPSLILECKKMPSPAAAEGMPRTYIGEILKAQAQ